MTITSSPFARDFPATARYLEKLPQGLRSYPDCQLLADGARWMQRTHAAVWRHTSLPPTLRTQLTQPWTSETWIPMVLAVAQAELVRESLGLPDEDYLTVAAGRALNLLQRPGYRAVVRVLTPHLLLLGMHWRWGKFHRGITLDSKGGSRYSHVIQMTQPEHIFPPISYRFYARVFTGLVALTGAQPGDVEIATMSPTRTQYVVRWGDVKPPER